jgi:hypothetical protein
VSTRQKSKYPIVGQALPKNGNVSFDPSILVSLKVLISNRNLSEGTYSGKVLSLLKTQKTPLKGSFE